MSFLESFLIGLVGGISDFLPVGGSGHRILLGRLVFDRAYDREFAGLCEISAALAATVALQKEIVELRPSLKSPGNRKNRVLASLLGATVIAALISLPFGDAYAEVSGDLVVVGTLLLVSGLLIYVAEEIGRRTHPLDSLKLPGAILLGLLGALALLPGVSRTGSTFSGGLLLGLTREAATQFALLLSIPLLIVSGVWNLSSGEGGVGAWATVAGFVAAFAGGFLAVVFLRWYAKRFSFKLFAYYLWAVGVFTILHEYLG